MKPGADDYSQPILSGEGESDYERYLRTDELLALQKTPEEQAHRDELLFQTVHQASELWLKLAWSEAEEATRLIEQGELAGAPSACCAARVLALDYVIAQLEMLEALSPWEYQAIRKVLGHGSGFDSPGFRQIRRVTPPLGQAFSAQLREAGLNVVSLYVAGARPGRPLPAGRAAALLGRADRALADAPLPGRGPGDRRPGGRHPGHAGRAAWAA